MKKLLIVIAVFLIGTSAALAGNATLKKDGKKYNLNCNSSGCFLSEKISMFKSGPQKRLGAGGVDNFNAWRAKLKKQGYK